MSAMFSNHSPALSLSRLVLLPSYSKIQIFRANHGRQTGQQKTHPRGNSNGTAAINILRFATAGHQQEKKLTNPRCKCSQLCLAKAVCKGRSLAPSRMHLQARGEASSQFSDCLNCCTTSSTQTVQLAYVCRSFGFTTRIHIQNLSIENLTEIFA